MGGSNTENKPWTNLQNSYNNWSNREKSNIAIAILEKFTIWTYPISHY